VDLTLSPTEEAFRDELRGWLEQNHPGEPPEDDKEAFEFSRRFTRLVDQFLLLALIAAAGTVCRLALLPSALFFESLLLAARKFFKTPFGFALLLLRLLLLRALESFILVFHLVEFELEKTRQLLLLSLAATATTAVALITKRDLNFAEDGVGCEQSL